jgi:integrase
MDTTPQTALDLSQLEALVEQTVARAAELIYQADQGGLAVARAWVFQDGKQVEKYGGAKASWYVGWYDPEGRQRCKSCGPGADGKKAAGKLKRQVEAQLLTGTYEANCNKLWAEFRPEYEGKVVAAKAPKTRAQVRMSLDNFERIVNPKKVSAVKTQTIDAFTAARRQEPRRYRRSGARPRRERKRPYADPGTVSVSSVNADLRNLKAALKVAWEWGYLKELPRFRMLRESRRLPVYVTPDDFAALYRACDAARLPAAQGYAAADWWRAFLVMTYVATGWRVGQLLALRREDLDLAAGRVLAAADVEGNKGKREQLFELHPLAVEHLKKLAGFGAAVFAWPHDRRTLDTEFHRLCEVAGVRRYGFHALRKGFGSMNAPRLSLAALQHLMQHKSVQTTQRYYVNPEAEGKLADKLHVPDVLKGKAG